MPCVCARCQCTSSFCIMGKKKNKKFSASKIHPTGLLPVNGDESELLSERPLAVITDILDQLQSADESARECGCATLAALASQPGAVPVLLSNNVVRIVAPLVIDPSPNVRHRALGALRNMTVDGGMDICHDMVLKDVLTPLVALFNQYGSNWEPEKGQTKYTDTRLDTCIQAVHVLWNLCEASDVAVTVFNKEGLLPLLVPCLQHSVYGYTLAIVVAQCLQTVTESNQEAVRLCQSDGILPSLKSLAEEAGSSGEAMLFQAALLGILINVLGDELINGPGLASCAVILSHILGVNHLALISDYATKATQQNGNSHMESSGDKSSEHCHSHLEEEVLPSDVDYHNIIHILDAQRICLELTTNICCSPEEAWEDVDSSESGSSDEITGIGNDEEPGMSTDNNNFDPLCAPTEVHAAFVANNIMAKVLQLSLPFPAELSSEMKNRKWWSKIADKLMRLRIHALLCINNLVEALSTEALGGIQALHQLWDTLAQQVLKPGPLDGAASKPTPVTHQAKPDLLEAITSAMRAVIQRLAQLNSPKFAEVSAADVHVLVCLAEGAASSVQIHVLRIVATVALMLVKTQHAVVQEVGEYLIATATHSTDLVVVAEALDALFDVFADDSTDNMAQSLQLTERLRAILPQLKVQQLIQLVNIITQRIAAAPDCPAVHTRCVTLVQSQESKLDPGMFGSAAVAASDSEKDAWRKLCHRIHIQDELEPLYQV